MSTNIIPKGAQSEMMAGLLFAMKGTCNCTGCKALASMADGIISTSKQKKVLKTKRPR